ncbi:MAG: ribosomal protein L7/L12 [Synergistes sp.]|nr:ribosomal protein L7/L12 [Synergistes sp.]
MTDEKYFKIVLTEHNGNIPAVIRAVMDITGAEPMAARKKVLAPPYIVAEMVPEKRAEELHKILATAGGTVESVRVKSPKNLRDDYLRSALNLITENDREKTKTAAENLLSVRKAVPEKELSLLTREFDDKFGVPSEDAASFRERYILTMRKIQQCDNAEEIAAAVNAITDNFCKEMREEIFGLLEETGEKLNFCAEEFEEDEDVLIFDVILTDAGANDISKLRETVSETADLKEYDREFGASELPAAIKKYVIRKTAKEIKDKLEAAGASAKVVLSEHPKVTTYLYDIYLIGYPNLDQTEILSEIFKYGESDFFCRNFSYNFNLLREPLPVAKNVSKDEGEELKRVFDGMGDAKLLLTTKKVTYRRGGIYEDFLRRREHFYLVGYWYKDETRHREDISRLVEADSREEAMERVKAKTEGFGQIVFCIKWPTF